MNLKIYSSTEFAVMSSLKPFQVISWFPKCQAALNQTEGCPAQEPAVVVTNRWQGALEGGQAGVIVHPSYTSHLPAIFCRRGGFLEPVCFV